MWLRHLFCPPHGAYFAPIHLCLLGQQVRCLESIVCLTLTSISAVFRSTQLGQIGNCSRIHSLPVRVVECFVLSFLSCTKSLTTFHYYSDGHVAGLQRTAKSSHRYSHMSSPSQIRTGSPLKMGPIALLSISLLTWISLIELLSHGLPKNMSTGHACRGT